MAAFKAILVLALFAVAVANSVPPTPETPEEKQDLAPVELSQLADALDNMFEQNLAFAEEVEVAEGALSRQKRACRQVSVRSRSGRMISVRRCS